MVIIIIINAKNIIYMCVCNYLFFTAILVIVLILLSPIV